MKKKQVVRRMLKEEKVEALKEAMALIEKELNIQLREDLREAKNPECSADPSFVRKQNKEIRFNWHVVDDTLQDRIRALGGDPG